MSIACATEYIVPFLLKSNKSMSKSADRFALGFLPCSNFSIVITRLGFFPIPLLESRDLLESIHF